MSNIELINNNIYKKNIKVVIKDIIKESNIVNSYILEGINKELLPIFIPGSYIKLRIRVDDKEYLRAFTITSSNNDLHSYKITIKLKEEGITKYLFDNYSIGDILEIEGIYNDLKYNYYDKTSLVFITYEAYITSFISIIMDNKDKDITLVYGARTSRDLIFKKLLDDLSHKYHNIKIIYALSEEVRDNYKSGMIDYDLLSTIDFNNKTVFVSGSDTFYKTMNPILVKLDIPNSKVHYEYFNYHNTLNDHGEFKMNVLLDNHTKTISVYKNETLLDSICRVFPCCITRVKLVEGEVKTLQNNLTNIDIKYNYINLNETYPVSNITILM